MYAYVRTIASRCLRFYAQVLLDTIFESRVCTITKYLVNGSMLEVVYILFMIIKNIIVFVKIELIIHMK